MITHKEQTAKIIHENIKTKGLQLSIVQKKKGQGTLINISLKIYKWLKNHMKRCSISLILRKIQIKTNRMAVIKNKILSVGKDVEELKLLCIAAGNVK